MILYCERLVKVRRKNAVINSQEKVSVFVHPTHRFVSVPV